MLCHPDHKHVKIVQCTLSGCCYCESYIGWDDTCYCDVYSITSSKQRRCHDKITQMICLENMYQSHITIMHLGNLKFWTTDDLASSLRQLPSSVSLAGIYQSGSVDTMPTTQAREVKNICFVWWTATSIYFHRCFAGWSETKWSTA